MGRQLHLKQERVIEAVRQGFEGEAAAAFIRQSGYAVTPAAIVRALHSLGGRDRLEVLIHQGYTNFEILRECFPREDLSGVPIAPPKQVELFAVDDDQERAPVAMGDFPELYDTTKMTLKLPSDLYEAIRGAAKAEGKTKTQLIVDILTAALSRMPSAIPRGLEGE